MEREYYVYILTTKQNSVLYTGVTSDIHRRLLQHRTCVSRRSFASRYFATKLVYMETFTEIEEAISREKQIKAGSRGKKVALIERANPRWKDLSESW